MLYVHLLFDKFIIKSKEYSHLGNCRKNIAKENKKLVAKKLAFQMWRLNTNLYKIKLICDNNNHGTLILPCRRPPIIIWKCKWSTRDIKWVWCGWRVVLRNELFRVPHSALSTTEVHRVAANKGGCAARHTRRNDGGAYATSMCVCVYADNGMWMSGEAVSQCWYLCSYCCHIVAVGLFRLLLHF